MLREFLEICQGNVLAEKTSDFASYLRWLSQQNESQALAFWQQALSGTKDQLLFPQCQGKSSTGQVAALERLLPGAELAKLRNAVGTDGLTLNTLLVAAWAVVLHAVTQRDELLFGTTVSGRPAELTGMAEIVGLFINTLPMPVRIAGSEGTLTNLAQAIQEWNLETAHFQHINLAQIQAETGHGHFDHLLIFENYPLGDGIRELLAGRSSQVRVKDVRFFEHTHYPLEIVILPGESLEMIFRYNAELLHAGQVAPLADSLLAVLRQYLAQPESQVGELAQVCSTMPIGIEPSTPKDSTLPTGAVQAGTGKASAEELKLATLFARILETKHFGVEDNFFQHGGHSLKVVRLSGLIWQELAREVPLKLIYANPTPRTLNKVLSVGQSGSLLDLRPFPEAASYPLTEGQKGLWLHQQLSKDSCAYNTLGSYQLEGPLDLNALKRALDALVDRHASLRTRFLTESGEPRQQVCASGAAPLEIVELGEQPNAEQKLKEQILSRLTEPFDLQQIPLFRATLFVLGSNRHLLSLIFHHIVSDGWSDEILAKDLSRIYQAQLSGEPSGLSLLPVEYRDYALAQQEYLQGKDSVGDCRFWQQLLVETAGQPDFLHDYPRPPQRAGQGARLSISLADQADAIRQLALNSQVTPFVILHALVKLIVHAMTGASDLIVGIPSANRSHPESQGLVGYFLNLLPIRTLFNDSWRFRDLLTSINRSMLEAFDHQEYPFSRMVDDLQLPKSFNRHPLFDIMIVFHNNQPTHFELGETSCTPFFEESTACRFDLDFEFFDDRHFAGFIEYDCQLYSEETVTRLAEALLSVTRIACSDPDISMVDLSDTVIQQLGAAQQDLVAALAMPIEEDF
ncbi:MAG: hypothetical protein C0614_12140 [Desulfuromonas sp.]|nr:MAG: hypothetical protein C0614_12140 [Desulfuromonas sp.]